MNSIPRISIVSSGRSILSAAQLLNIANELKKRKYCINFLAGESTAPLFEKAGYTVKITEELPAGLEYALGVSSDYLKRHTNGLFNPGSEIAFSIDKLLETDLAICMEFSPDIIVSDGRFLVPQLTESYKGSMVWLYSQWGDAFIDFAEYLKREKYHGNLISSEMFLDFMQHREAHPLSNLYKNYLLTLIPNITEFANTEMKSIAGNSKHIHFTGPFLNSIPTGAESVPVRKNRKTLLLGLDCFYPFKSLYNKIKQLADEGNYQLRLFMMQNIGDKSGLWEQFKAFPFISFSELPQSLDTCDLLITSGSPLLCLYAISREVPCLIFPVNTEQTHMAEKLAALNLGGLLGGYPDDITSQDLQEQIDLLLSNTDTKTTAYAYKNLLSGSQNPVCKAADIIQQKDKDRLRFFMVSALLSHIKQETWIEKRKILFSSDLRELAILPTLRCQYSCDYCIQDQAIDTHQLRKDNTESFKEVEVDRWISFIKTVSETCSIVLSGGEPTLYRDLPELVQSVVEDKNHKLTVVTNHNQSPQYYQKMLDMGVQMVGSLHQDIKPREEEAILRKILQINSPWYIVRILTDFSDRERVERLSSFMHQHKKNYCLGIIYRIKNGRYAILGSKYYSAYSDRELSRMNEQVLQNQLVRDRAEIIPQWADDIIKRSNGQGTIDFEAIKNFILFPSYFSATVTRRVLCNAPRKHLTIFPNGSAWICNIQIGNAFDLGFQAIADQIECPDFGHCLETCIKPPFVEELKHSFLTI